jgi:hypothetical protein
MRVGIICEGRTDFVVLRSVCRDVLGRDGLVVELLQPDFDALQRNNEMGAEGDPRPPGTGWQGVRAFLAATQNSLSATVHDLIVVHVDADIRKLPAITSKLIAVHSSPELEPLCNHIKSWSRQTLPDSVIIVLPRESTESWLLAANTNRHDVKVIDDPAEALHNAGLIGVKAGSVYKTSTIYETLALRLADLVSNKRMLRRVPELERFVGKLQARAAAVRRSAKKRP